MAKSTASSSAVSRQGLIPIWGCGVTMRIWIANTAENRGRRFWKCKQWGKPTSCDLFKWDDELDMETINMVAAASEVNEGLVKHSTQRVCECNCGKILKDWESNKIGKLKMKVLEERKKMKWMQAIVVFLIVVVVFLKFQIDQN